MTLMLRDGLLNGLFIGLLVYAGIATANAGAVNVIALSMAGALAIGLLIAAVAHRRANSRLRVLVLIVEYPAIIQASLFAGLCIATFWVRTTSHAWLLTGCIIGGLALGLGMHAIRLMPMRWPRVGSAGVLAALAATACLAEPAILARVDQPILGRVLLLGLPFFCVLVFAANIARLEPEAAALCAVLAVGVYLCGLSLVATVVASVALYYLLVAQWLPRVPGFKAILRGFAYASSGHSGRALVELGRAARLEPDNQHVREVLWTLHQGVDAQSFATDPDLVNFIDPHLCLERVASLLNEPPTQAQLGEANHLLNLIERHDARLRPVVAYWRAVASAHERDVEAVTWQLNALLDPSIWLADDAQRRSILFSAWQLALLLHPRLEEMVGQPQLAQPGRLLEAIDAVEGRLADAPEDQAAWNLKRLLYPRLTQQHLAAHPNGRIDADYVEQLGQAMIAQSATRAQGAELLVIAAARKPADAPRLCLQAAEVLDAIGDKLAASNARQLGLDAVRRVGAHVLSEPSRQAYFTIVKWMADEAASRRDLDTAIGLYQLYTECSESGVETLRTLADLHEQRQDAWPALHAVARALVYLPNDADLLAKRDRYLYSIEPGQLQAAAEPLRRSVDAGYCAVAAQRLLDLREADADLIAWAKHLAELAVVLRPAQLQLRLLLARALMRLGERDKALPLLEDIREQRPGKLAGDAEEEAWFTANRFLGDMYLHDFNRPDLAIGCFTDFRDSPRSGADTLYKLGLAHERLGEKAKAAAFYQQVLGYDNHPLASEAREALRRVY